MALGPQRGIVRVIEQIRLDDIRSLLCADCERQIVKCPGQARRCFDGEIRCEPCFLTRGIKAAQQPHSLMT